jgi:RNA polymerase sigma-70 factor (ECF subfamily)
VPQEISFAADTPAEKPEPEDFTLIRRFLRTGEGKDFRRLVEPHLPMLRRLLYTLLRGQREDMEDAEQDILLELSRSLSAFGFRSSFRTFLYSLARHRAIDLLRSAGRRRRLLQRLRLQARTKEPAVEPTEGADRQETNRCLLVAFQTVCPAERQLVLLKDVEGFSIEEIAALLALPAGTVKSRLHRARRKLARLLRGRTWT